MKTKGPIMVVDDDDNVRRMMCVMLEAEGYSAVGARDGLDALERMRSVSPSLVFVDLMMPRMDGEHSNPFDAGGRCPVAHSDRHHVGADPCAQGAVRGNSAHETGRTRRGPFGRRSLQPGAPAGGVRTRDAKGVVSARLGTVLALQASFTRQHLQWCRIPPTAAGRLVLPRPDVVALGSSMFESLRV